MTAQDQDDIEFQIKAVQLALTRTNRSAVARELGVAPGTLRSWIRIYRKMVETGLSAEKLALIQTENNEMDRKIADLEEDLEILKKAVQFLTKKR